MKERIKKLTELLEEILSDCYGDRYGIADFVEGNDNLEKQMEKLATESAFYQKTLDNLSELLLNKNK